MLYVSMKKKAKCTCEWDAKIAIVFPFQVKGFTGFRAAFTKTVRRHRYLWLLSVDEYVCRKSDVSVWLIIGFCFDGWLGICNSQCLSNKCAIKICVKIKKSFYFILIYNLNYLVLFSIRFNIQSLNISINIYMYNL